MIAQWSYWISRSGLSSLFHQTSAEEPNGALEATCAAHLSLLISSSRALESLAEHIQLDVYSAATTHLLRSNYLAQRTSCDYECRPSRGQKSSGAQWPSRAPELGPRLDRTDVADPEPEGRLGSSAHQEPETAAGLASGAAGARAVVRGSIGG